MHRWRRPHEWRVLYNKNVDTLYKVAATLDWVTESHASATPVGDEHLRRYSRTDHYTYILEVKDGEVVGGEWYGNSITNHPDFVWLPFRPLNGNHYVKIDKVRLLGEMAQEDQAAAGGPMPALLNSTSGDISIAIPDNNREGISHTIEVGDVATVESATIDIDIDHTYIGDLVIKVTNPAGTEFVLHKKGGSADDVKKTFTIDGVGAINGVWTISVSDNYGADLGTLNSWGLNFRVGETAAAANETVSEFTNDRVADIPDNNTEGVSSYIDIDASGSIKGLELALDISHTYISDLEITLKKGGISKVFFNREGGSDDNIKRTFSMDEFNGQDMQGRWYLNIRDLAHLDAGSRNGWTLKVTH